MPQHGINKRRIRLEGEIRLPAWEHWQIQEQARPIRVVSAATGRGRTGADRKLPDGAGLYFRWAGADPKCHSDGDFGASGTTGGRPFERRDGG